MTNNYLISMQKGFLALMSAALLFSCSQIEPFEMEKNDVLRSVESMVPAIQFPASVNNEICEDNCLTLGEAVTFYKNFDSGELREGSAVTKQVKATVYLIINDQNRAYYKVDYESRRISGSSNEDVNITGTLNGETFSTLGGKWNTTNPVQGTFSTALFDYTNVECGDTFNFTFNETSKAANVNWNENIAQLAYCIDDCEDKLTVELECDDINTATFTFLAEEAGPIVIQGGLTNGTTIISAISEELDRNETHSSVQNSNANVTRWEGNVSACQEVTITIKFAGGSGIGDWSAKRENDILGSTEAKGCN